MTDLEIQETAWEHGWLFGKYTKQVILSDDLLKILDNSERLILLYNQHYNLGFKSGVADTVRQDFPD